MLKVAHINLAKGFRGGERQTAILIEELAQFGFSQTIIYRDDSFRGLAQYLLKRSIPNLEFVKIAKPYFLHIFKFKGYDIIHAHEAKAYQLAYLINKVLNIPYIITRRVQFTPKRNIFNLAIYRNAKIVIALSSAIKRDVEKLDKDLNIEIIPSAFYYDKNLNREILPISVQNKKIIGHIGAVVNHHKGQCTILESAKLLSKKRDDIHFVLIGDGVDLEMCKSKSKELNNISFLGFLDNPQRFIYNFDIFIFPSNHEGLGSTLLDVMKEGIPIIASKVGGIVDIIEDGVNGYLIEPRNSIELSKKIEELIDDEVIKNRFLQNNIERVKQFSPKQMAEKYQMIYNIKL